MCSIKNTGAVKCEGARLERAITVIDQKGVELAHKAIQAVADANEAKAAEAKAKKDEADRKRKERDAKATAARATKQPDRKSMVRSGVKVTIDKSRAQGERKEPLSVHAK